MWPGRFRLNLTPHLLLLPSMALFASTLPDITVPVKQPVRPPAIPAAAEPAPARWRSDDDGGPVLRRRPLRMSGDWDRIVDADVATPELVLWS